MALVDLVGKPDVAAAIMGEALVARELLGAQLDRILDGLLDRRTTRLPERSCKVLFEGLEARPFHNASEFEVARDLETSWDDIREELSAACHHGPFSTYRQTDGDFTDADHWLTLNLLLPAGRLAPHASLCPKTTAILRASDMFCEVAMISRLRPGGHIRPHCGPWNARLIAHVGITAPASATMRVSSELRQWDEGRALIFDDSFEHECWNHSKIDRFILLFAIWHPDWLEHERVLLKNVERLIAGIYWDSEEAGFLKQFDELLLISNCHSQSALWPVKLSIPSDWTPVTASSHRWTTTHRSVG